MQPRLIAISGPLAGQTFPLGRTRLTLGRSHDNDLCLGDITVSRHHCVIEPAGERFRLRDLDSRFSTLVNGLPVHERELEHSNLITIGESLFLFLTREEEDDAGAGPVLFDGETFTAGSTTQLVLGESRYLQPDVILAALPPEARTARDLQALLRIGNDLHALHAVEPIARRLLELALETIPAERATVLLMDAGTAEPATSFALDRRGSTAPFAVSRTLVERVLAERSSLRANDVLQEAGDWNGVESVVAARLQSLLAAPLIGAEGPSGVLYRGRSPCAPPRGDGR